MRRDRITEIVSLFLYRLMFSLFYGDDERMKFPIMPTL